MKKISLILIIFILIICIFTCMDGVKNGKKIKSIERYIKLLIGFSNIDPEAPIKNGDYKNFEEVKEVYRKYAIIDENYIIKSRYELVKKIEFSQEYGLLEYSFGPHGMIYYPKLSYCFQNGDLWFSRVPSGNSFNAINMLFKKNEDRFIKMEIDLNRKMTSHLPIDFTVDIDSVLYKLEYDLDSLNYFVNIKGKQRVIINRDKMPYGIGNGFLLSYNLKGNYIWAHNNAIAVSAWDNIHDKMIYVYNYEKEKIENIFIYPFTSYYGVLAGNLKDRLYFNFSAGGLDPDTVEKMYGFKPDSSHIMIHDFKQKKIYHMFFSNMDEHSRGQRIIRGGSTVLGEDDNIYYQLITDQAYYIYKLTPLWDEPMENTEYRPYFFEFHPDIKVKWDALIRDEKKAANQ